MGPICAYNEGGTQMYSQCRTGASYCSSTTSRRGQGSKPAISKDYVGLSNMAHAGWVVTTPPLAGIWRIIHMNGEQKETLQELRLRAIIGEYVAPGAE